MMTCPTLQSGIDDRICCQPALDRGAGVSHRADAAGVGSLTRGSRCCRAGAGGHSRLGTLVSHRQIGLAPLPASPLRPGCAPQSQPRRSNPRSAALTLCRAPPTRCASSSCVILWPITPLSSRGWLSSTFATRRGRSRNTRSTCLRRQLPQVGRNRTRQGLGNRRRLPAQVLDHLARNEKQAAVLQGFGVG